MSNQPLPTPGWYPDPAGQGSRYWDGSRWTEHTQAVPAPAQPPIASRASAPVAHPASGPSIGTTEVKSTAFVDQLKRGEAVALILVGAALVVLSTMLPWAKLTLNVPGAPEVSDSGTAWASDVPWLIRGFDAEEFRVALVLELDGQGSGAPAGGTDLIVLLPLLAGAVGVVLASRQGKQITRSAEIVTGCCALLLVLLVLEITHLGSWTNELQDRIVETGGSGTVGGGAAFGLWLATAAAALMTFGAIRSLRAARVR